MVCVGGVHVGGVCVCIVGECWWCIVGECWWCVLWGVCIGSEWVCGGGVLVMSVSVGGVCMCIGGASV